MAEKTVELDDLGLSRRAESRENLLEAAADEEDGGGHVLTDVPGGFAASGGTATAFSVSVNLANTVLGAGMLALLQAVHFHKSHPKLEAAIYRLSRGERDFPFMTVSITMTQLALQALRSGALTRLANSSKQVYETFHCFHHACYLYMFSAWQKRSLSIHDFGFLKKELATLVHRKPGRLMRELITAREARRAAFAAHVS